MGLPRASETATTGALPGLPPPVSVDELESVLAPLAETSTLRLSAEGRSLRGLRLFAQRALFRVLRPLWFQQHQFHAQLIAALRLTVGAIRTEQQAREIVDARVRELTRKLLSARRETNRLERLVARIELEQRPASAGLSQPTANEAALSGNPPNEEQRG